MVELLLLKVRFKFVCQNMILLDFESICVIFNFPYNTSLEKKKKGSLLCGANFICVVSYVNRSIIHLRLIYLAVTHLISCQVRCHDTIKIIDYMGVLTKPIQCPSPSWHIQGHPWWMENYVLLFFNFLYLQSIQGIYVLENVHNRK